MRIRYFIITSIVVLNVSFFSLLMHNNLLEKNQIENSDNLLKQIAITFLSTEWGDPGRNELERIESITSYEIGDNLSRFFILRDTSGKIIYKSRSVDFIDLEETPTEPEWLSFEKDSWQMRVYNIKNPRYPNRILQLGLISSAGQNLGFLASTSIFLFSSISLLGLLSSWLLSTFMFAPIGKVGDFLSQVSASLDRRGILPNVPKKLFFSSHSKDEFGMLTKDLDSLINKINSNSKMSRLWAAQMAHELKTPLSQLLLHIEATSDEGDLNAQKNFVYIDRIKNTVNSFLNWAELENSLADPTRLEDIPLKSCVNQILNLLPEELKNRVVLQTESNITVKSSPDHVFQLAQNIISNALKYSEATVTIKILKNSFLVQDHGPGMPHNVLEKIGDPFNFENSKSEKKGHGLGLAWVKTICNLYNWKIQIMSSPKGTNIEVIF